MLSATLKTVPSESKKPSLKKTLAKKRKAKKDGADAPAPKRAKRVNSWQKYEGKGTDEKKKRKKGDDTDAAHQTVHRTFVSKRLHEKADDAQAKELYVKPIRTYDQNTLAWLVANPKFIANRVCQQYLPGLVNVRFCRGQGLLLFHNEYAAKQLLKRKKVEIDGQGYELEAFQPKLHRQLKTLGKVFNNYGYKKYHPAVIKAQVVHTPQLPCVCLPLVLFPPPAPQSPQVRHDWECLGDLCCATALPCSSGTLCVPLLSPLCGPLLSPLCGPLLSPLCGPLLSPLCSPAYLLPSEARCLWYSRCWFAPSACAAPTSCRVCSET